MAHTEDTGEAEDGGSAEASSQHVRQPPLQRHTSRRARIEWLRSVMASMKCDQSQPRLALASADVIGFLECGSTTYFRIRVCMPQGSWSWDVLRRYSEFRVLRDALCIGSRFPKKTGPFRCKGSRLAERQQILQAWVQSVVAEYAALSHLELGRVVPDHFERKLALLHEFLGIGQDGALVASVVLTTIAQATCFPACNCYAACNCVPAVRMLASERIACTQKAEALHTACHSRDPTLHITEDSDTSTTCSRSSGDISVESRVCGRTAISSSMVAQSGVGACTFRVDVPHGLPSGKAFEVQAAGARYAVIVPAEHDGLVEFDISGAGSAAAVCGCR